MVTVFSSIVNGRTKTSSCFHFFMFLTIQCQVVFALLSMVVAISEEGNLGSKRNISMVAPVALWNNKRAGITLVLLKNKLASAGSCSTIFMKLLCSIFPCLPLYTKSFDIGRA